MGLTPGDLVSQHVRLVRELKRGGMGSVWVADHLALQTQVAVKFMATSIADDAAAVARFAREATSAAQIKSPHVVQVHDHGLTPEGLPYMVMELLHGVDLSTRIKQGGPISVEEAAAIVAQVCRVLSRAHPLGIVHRDIKPSNLFLLDADGEVFVKVLDFGVAKFGNAGESELTTTGVTVGTLAYMSPEQLLSAKTVDHRADLWSLAVSMYQAITGEVPFKLDDGLGALCKALEQGRFARPSAYVAGLPPALDAWFERAFEPRLDARFDSAKDMAATLRRAMGGLPSQSSVLVLDAPSSVGPRSLPRPALLEADAGPLSQPRHQADPNVTVSEGPASRRRATDAELKVAEALTPPPRRNKPESASPPHTLAGTASARPALRGRDGRRSVVRMIGLMIVFGALGAGLVLARTQIYQAFAFLRAAPPATAAPTVQPARETAVNTMASTTAKTSVTSPLAGAPVTTGSPAGAPLVTAATSAAPPNSRAAPPTSAAPVVSGGTLPPAPSGKGRARPAEKDYGF